MLPKFGGLQDPLRDVAYLLDVVANPQDEVRAVDDPRHVSSPDAPTQMNTSQRKLFAFILILLKLGIKDAFHPRQRRTALGKA